MNTSIIFGGLASLSLGFSLYKLWRITRLLKTYTDIKTKVALMKSNNTLTRANYDELIKQYDKELVIIAFEEIIALNSATTPNKTQTSQTQEQNAASPSKPTQTTSTSNTSVNKPIMPAQNNSISSQSNKSEQKEIEKSKRTYVIDLRD